MKIALSCESTVDLPKELLDRFNIHTIPFYIVFGEETEPDGEGVQQKIFDYVARTGELAKTSAINEVQYEKYFSDLLKEYDAIIHITLSSKITSSINHAENVAKKLGEDKVKIIDSLSLSTGIALQVLYARKLIDAGLPLETIVDKIESRRSDVQAGFVLCKLNYLHKGGRCSGMAVFGANLLKIKPEIILKDGSMIVGKKYMGTLSHALNSYCDNLLEKHKDADRENVFITYSTADPSDVASLRAKLEAFGFKNIYATTAGATITCHCGPQCIGVLFYGKEEK